MKQKLAFFLWFILGVAMVSFGLCQYDWRLAPIFIGSVILIDVMKGET